MSRKVKNIVEGTIGGRLGTPPTMHTLPVLKFTIGGNPVGDTIRLVSDSTRTVILHPQAYEREETADRNE